MTTTVVTRHCARCNGLLMVAQEQEAWLNELCQVPGVEAYLWYPLDWLSGEIECVLGRVERVKR